VSVPTVSVADLVRGTQGALVGGCLERVTTGVSIDSRSCRPGEVFFAIRGHNQDGHAFLADALGRGAGAAVVSRYPAELALPGDFPLVLVEDTTRALQRLGAFHRRRHTLPVVGVTGSIGKTTTKELTAAVLAERFHVLKATGSLNNQWGVPLTLLGLEPTHGAAVLELGMNAFGEIATLAQLARPSVGVLTTIAPAHLEGVGSLEGVQKAKGELVEAIPADGVVILNADDPLVLTLASAARGRVVTYGRAASAEVRLSDIAPLDGGLSFTVAHRGEAVAMRLPLPGRHNAGNAAAAVAVGLALGVPLAVAARGLGRVSPVKGRLHWREAGGVRLLDDTYNASPVSLRAALEALREAGPAGRMWVVFGDMLELGPASDAAHTDAGRWIAALPAAGLATAGPASRASAATAAEAGCPEVTACQTPEEAAAHVAARVEAGDRVLVKGSRGMRMERAVDVLLRELGRAGRGRPEC
jgi:UDP-N-acetylmuramoyl-tripeptide--D-alanyl-D-alanine ligase